MGRVLSTDQSHRTAPDVKAVADDGHVRLVHGIRSPAYPEDRRREHACTNHGGIQPMFDIQQAHRGRGSSTQHPDVELVERQHGDNCHGGASESRCERIADMLRGEAGNHGEDGGDGDKPGEQDTKVEGEI